jgi:FG-GAP repeat
MRRLSTVLVLGLMAMVWSGASGASAAPGATAAQAAGSLQADFNNDGFIDLAVGVPGEAIGAIQSAGAVNVLYGAAGGLAGPGGQLFSQDSAGVAGTAEAFDSFGAALDAGDFNNDGFADLAVGVPGEDIGAIPDAGAINVLYGSASGLTGTGSQAFWQGAGGIGGTPERFDNFGWTLAAGDFNNNGFADLAIGTPAEDVGAVSDAGAVNVLYGGGGGLAAAGNQQFWQGAGGIAGTAEVGDNFGSALAAGDFNNNGFADLAVGVPFEAIGTRFHAGAVNVLYGGGGGLAPAGNQQFWQGASGVGGTAEEFDQFGLALDAGDFNNDGPADLAVGVPGESIGAIFETGAVTLLYGSGGGLAGAGGQLFSQASAGVAGTAERFDHFGAAVSSGDFNNNGIADMAVGVPDEDVGATSDAGAVNVLYGTSGGLTATGSQQFWQGAGGVAGAAEAFDNFGWTVSAGDFKGNGFVDLAIGVPFEAIGAIQGAGAVNVLYGAGGGITTVGNQSFRQGASGVAGTAEVGDNFGFALLGSDQPAVSAG